jgi:hypothetical protein
MVAPGVGLVTVILICDPLQTAPLPPPVVLSIVNVGTGLIVTVYGAVVTTQPVAVIVSPTVNVPVPEAPQVTVMLFVPAPAVIDPPEIVHT